MKKKVYSSLLKIYEFPLFFDREDFYDKSVSFLYMQFKFKEIEGINKEDLGFDVSLFEHGAIVAIHQDQEADSLSKKNISELKAIKRIVICVDRTEMKDFLSFRIGKTAMEMFDDIKDIKEFFVNIENFFNRQEKYFKDIKSYLLKQKQLSSDKEKSDLDNNVQKVAQENKTEFLSVNAKNMPEKIKLTPSIEKAEAVLIKEMLRRTKGKKVEAAKSLGITERMIGYKIKKYELG